MTTFRPDTSFPYLKVAREYGLDYGTVIRWVEDIGLGPNTDPWWEEWQAAAWLAHDSEMSRQLMVSLS
jgi:hypothetical protein